MGYYSNVTIFIEENEPNEIENYIEQANFVDTYAEANFTIGINSKGKRVLKVEYNDVKWYTDFRIVKYWDNLLSNMNEERYLYGEIGQDGESTIKGEYGYADKIVALSFEYVDFF